MERSRITLQQTPLLSVQYTDKEFNTSLVEPSGTVIKFEPSCLTTISPISHIYNRNRFTPDLRIEIVNRRYIRPLSKIEKIRSRSDRHITSIVVL